ncbi:hypothetical protein GN244_ATG00694 [Phytophthora infestans]|uniref:Uncharacterized protein n=1 Tax=Phytophthora infestans TaxID=4787 RepID=A0A833X2M2_PHYIN|nr:hypothetical protein GN244_ATG00694 [Phytophthora infestans]
MSAEDATCASSPQRQQQSYQHRRLTWSSRETTAASNHRVNAYEKKDPDIETELFEHLTIKATDFGGDTESRLYQLLVKQDKVNGQAIKVSLDRGADHNAIRQGFATEVARRKKAVAERFDDKPWLSRFNPVINWCTHKSWRKVKPPATRNATRMICAG